MGCANGLNRVSLKLMYWSSSHRYLFPWAKLLQLSLGKMKSLGVGPNPVGLVSLQRYKNTGELETMHLKTAWPASRWLNQSKALGGRNCPVILPPSGSSAKSFVWLPSCRFCSSHTGFLAVFTTHHQAPFCTHCPLVGWPFHRHLHNGFLQVFPQSSREWLKMGMLQRAVLFLCSCQSSLKYVLVSLKTSEWKL